MSGADVIEQRIKAATEGMPKACFDKLLRLDNGNGVIIADYLIKYKLEATKGVKDSTRATVCNNLELFARRVNKPFFDITRNDVLGYLYGLKKPEDEDPRQKWKGVATLYSIHITQFFKWLHYPDVGPKRRQPPAIVADLPRYEKPETPYETGDLWLEEDNKIFLKYCPQNYPKIKCYHAIAAFTGARPHEILNLKMGDIKWLPNGQPTFPVTGKTGRRQLRILSPYYIDYLKKWIELHPKGTVPSSYLIYSKKTGGKLTHNSLWSIYIRELKPHFTKLLDEAIGQDDRKQIEQLLKPWNPYVIRHSTATEYLVRKRRLSGNHANQWFGWKKESNMPAIYGHFYGNEAEELLAESFGLKPEIKKESLPELRVCPSVNCKEPNNPDAPFCRKCRGPLTIAGYMEEVNEREGEIHELKQQMDQSRQEIKDRFQAYESKMAQFVHDIKRELNYEERSSSISKLVMDKMTEILDHVAPDWFQEVYGPNAHRLTPKAHEKINGWLKILTAQIDAENSQRDLELQKQKKVLIDSIGTNV
jgi:integrase